MEKLNYFVIKNGVLRLPPGFRFHPTDEELVVQYLKRKVFLCPLPAFVIPEVDVCKSDPWDLPGVYTYIHSIKLIIDYHHTRLFDLLNHNMMKSNNVRLSCIYAFRNSKF